MIFKRINSEAIDYSLNYEGYYWYSNAQVPQMVINEKIDASIFGTLPFIIEGALYCKETELSIRIKNVDGKYFISRIDLSNLEVIEHDEKVYLGHDINFAKYKMIEAWEAVADPLMEGIEILRPSWSAFKGFVK